MAQYLLAQNALIDLCFQHTASNTWLANVKTTDLFTSVIAVSAAKEAIALQSTHPRELRRLNTTFGQILARLQNGGLIVLPFDAKEAEEWETWRTFPSLEAEVKGHRFEIGQDVRMVIATAAANGLELVEPAELYHDALRGQGLLVTSL